jgi:hypothetical protein
MTETKRAVNETASPITQTASLKTLTATINTTAPRSLRRCSPQYSRAVRKVPRCERKLRKQNAEKRRMSDDELLIISIVVVFKALRAS